MRVSDLAPVAPTLNHAPAETAKADAIGPSKTDGSADRKRDQTPIAQPTDEAKTLSKRKERKAAKTKAAAETAKVAAKTAKAASDTAKAAETSKSGPIVSSVPQNELAAAAVDGKAPAKEGDIKRAEGKPKVVKQYAVNRWSCADVVKLKGGVVCKRYKLGNPVHKERFEREAKLLTHLAGCDFVPQVVKIDRELGEVHMTDCGTNLDNLAFWERRKYERRIPSLIRALFDRYGLMRVRRNGKQKFRVPPRNATLRDGKVCIIDFNGSKWRLPGEYPQSANPPPIPSKPP